MQREVHISQKLPFKKSVTTWLKRHFHYSKRFPIVNTLRNYRPSHIKGDIIAGFTVGLLLVPQSLAMAGIVGGPTVNGLYSSLMGPLASLIFSTCPDSSVGPTVLVAVAAARFNQFESPIYMSVLSFFAGIVMIVLGLLNAGVIMKLVSMVVFSSFVTVGSVTIIISQLPTLFGVKIRGAGSLDSYSLLYIFLSRIDETRLTDFAIGASCVIACLVLHYMLPLLNRFMERTTSKYLKIILQVVRFVFIGKNALLTILMTVIAYAVTTGYKDHNYISLTGVLQPGLPKPRSPFRSAINAETAESIPLPQIVSNTALGFILVPIVMFVETLAVVKLFSRQKNYVADCSQELINVGVANVLNSFFQGFPIGGALSRSSVNAVSGVRSTLSGIITFIILILALMVLTPVFYYIPKASLAGMLIAAVIPSMNFSILGLIWRTRRWEYLPWFATFFVGLYSLDYGMMAGIALSASFILFREVRPRTHRIHHTDRGTGSYTVRLRASLHYPGADFIVDKVMSFKQVCPDLNQLYVDCHSMQETDITVATELLTAILKMKSEQDVNVNLVYVKSGAVKRIFVEVGLEPYILDHQNTEVSNCLHCRKYHVHDILDNVDVKNNLETVASAPTRYFSKQRLPTDPEAVPASDVQCEVEQTEENVFPDQNIADASSLSSSSSTSESNTTVEV